MSYSDLQQLRWIEIRCARQVCSGGIITKAEADKLEALREKTGQTYDAVNRRFSLYVEG